MTPKKIEDLSEEDLNAVIEWLEFEASQIEIEGTGIPEHWEGWVDGLTTMADRLKHRLF